MSTAQSNRKLILIVVVAFISSITIGLISKDPILGSAILLCGLLQSYFASIGKRSNYILGLISYILMGAVALANHLYGTGGFYLLICAPLQIHGFLSWGKNLKNQSVKTRKFTLKTSILVILACLGGSLLVGFLLDLIPSQQLNFLDAASNCVNLCGIILMNLRYIEAWWLWLINNIIDFTIWAYILLAGTGNSNAPMMFITCVMYLIINVYGIYKWMKQSRIDNKAKTS